MNLSLLGGSILSSGPRYRSMLLPVARGAAHLLPAPTGLASEPLCPSRCWQMVQAHVSIPWPGSVALQRLAPSKRRL